MTRHRMLVMFAALVVGVWLSGGAALAWPTKVTGSCSNAAGSHYSGTNAMIGGHWKAGIGIKWIELWVEDLRVYRHDFNPPYPTTWPPPPNDGEGNYCWTPFSTTQWNHATVLTLKACLGTPNGGYNKNELDVTAWNMSYTAYDPGLTYGAQCAGYANSACSSAHHSTLGPASNHSEATMLGNLPHRQVFYIDTHGSHNSFQACDGMSINAGEVYDALGNRVAGDPGYNIVFIDACNSGDPDWALYAGFCRGVMQSYLGWQGSTYDCAPKRNWVKKLWEELQAQSTMGQARVTATTQEPSITNSRQPGGHAGYRLHRTYAGC